MVAPGLQVHRGGYNAMRLGHRARYGPFVAQSPVTLPDLPSVAEYSGFQGLGYRAIPGTLKWSSEARIPPT